MHAPNPAVVGLDVGHSAVKVSADYAGQLIASTFPSAVTEAVIPSEAQTRRSAEPDTVTVDGRRFFVRRTALVQGRLEREPGLTETWVTSPQYEALFGEAWPSSLAAPAARHSMALGLSSDCPKNLRLLPDQEKAAPRSGLGEIQRLLVAA